MADRTIFTREMARFEATAALQSLVNTLVPTPAPAKLRLFDGTLVPDENTVEADLVAAETTLVGYPAGGYTIDDLAGPSNDPLGGADLFTPLIDIAYASGAAVTIGGGWIEDAAGNPRVAFIFDPQRVLAQVGDSIPFVRALVYGRNALVF